VSGADRRGSRLLFGGGLLGAAAWALFSLSLASERVWWAPLESPSGPARALAGLASALTRSGVAGRIGAEEGTVSAAAFGLALAAACGAWGLLVAAARARALPPAGVLALAALFAAIAGSAPGLLSSDVHAYVRLGRMAALLGANPFLRPPAAVPDAYVDDRWFMAEVTSPYGPLWISIAALLARLADLAGLGFGAAVQLYRGLAIACHCLNAALVRRIAESLRPGSGLAASAAFALCPLAIVEVGSSAHNDVLVIALLLLGIGAQQRARTLRASALFAAASLIKLYALLAWGAHAVLVARSSPDRAAAAARTLPLAIGAAGLAALAYLPFWEGPSTLAGLRMLVGLLLGLSPTNSLAEWTAAHWPAGVWPSDPGGALRLAGGLGAVAFLGTVAWLAAAVRDLPSFLRALHGGFFAWSAFGAAWNQPWYALAATALAALSPASPLRTATWVLSVSVLAIYPLHALELPGLYAHRALFMAGIPLACLGLAPLAGRRARTAATRLPPRPPRAPPPRPGA